MNTRNLVLGILLALAMITAFLLVTVLIAVGEARTQASAPIATAQVPFDFWISDTQQPAGAYELSRVLKLKTVVLLRNTKTNAQEQAFLVPTGEAVASGDYKLVFVLRNGRHYLQEIWDSDGQAVLTSQIGVSLGPADTRSEVRLTAQGAANTVGDAE